MKKIALFSLGITTGIMVATIIPSTIAAIAGFKDVPKDSWYEKSVNNMQLAGIIQGYPDGTFQPENAVSRAELSIMLDRFKDYSDAHYVKKDIPTNTDGAQNLTTSGTQEISSAQSQMLIDDFNLFESTAYKFKIQYPKQWYYSGDISNQGDLIKRYNFSNKPLDGDTQAVQAEIVSLDLLSSAIPSGESVTFSAKNLIKTTSGNTVQIYTSGNNKRVYRLSGPIQFEETLIKMASTIED